jgi:hypothetical protein
LLLLALLPLLLLLLYELCMRLRACAHEIDVQLSDGVVWVVALQSSRIAAPHAKHAQKTKHASSCCCEHEHAYTLTSGFEAMHLTPDAVQWHHLTCALLVVLLPLLWVAEHLVRILR